MNRLRKRLILLLVFVISLMPISIFANDSNKKITVSCPQIEIYKLPYTITTESNINISIDVPDEFTRFDIIYISWDGGRFNRDGTAAYEKQYPHYRTTADAIELNYDSWDDRSAVIRVLDSRRKHIEFPVVGEVTEKESKFYIAVINWKDGRRFNFSKYIDKATTTSNINQVTTPSAITTNPNDPTYPTRNYPSNTTIYNNTSSQYNHDESNSSSNDDASKDSSIPKNVTVTQDSPTTYLNKDDIKSERVEFADIDPASEEANLIRRLAEKGIITQDGEIFDIKKELTKDESLNYLARLLVVNDAAKSKLDDETIKKYLNPENENFAYLATVGSMLQEDTLKTISESTEMSRELFAEILNEVTSLEVENQETPFTDLDGATYKEALVYCYNAGLLIGTSKNTMSPSDIITNGQMLQVLSRLDDALSGEAE